MIPRTVWFAGALCSALGACEEDPMPPPPPIGGPVANPGGVVVPVGGAVAPPSTITDGRDTDGRGDTGLDTGGITATATDTLTGGRECRSSCDCAPLLNCTADGCVPASEIRYCCTDDLCPTDAPCETPDARLSVCP